MTSRRVCTAGHEWGHHDGYSPTCTCGFKKRQGGNVKDNNEQNVQPEDREESECFQFLMRHKFLKCCCMACPRLLALLLGVVLPLWVLIFISIIFGQILSGI